MISLIWSVIGITLLILSFVKVGQESVNFAIIGLCCIILSYVSNIHNKGK